jgi:hypothetical protein
VDPIADRFPHVSPFNYAENEPIANIDLWGLQKVSANDIRNSQGQITKRDVTVSVSMKVLNLSSRDNIHFNNSLSRAGERASRSFNTSFNARVLDSPQTGLTSNEVPVNVKFTLSIQQVSSLDQVKDIDFLSIIVDKVDNSVEHGNISGWGEQGGNISVIEAGAMDGSSSEVLLHELGHNLGLDCGGKYGHTKDGSGLMGAKVNGQYSIDKNALKLMFQGMPVTGQSMQIQHSNTVGRAKDFLNEYGDSYDKTKAKKSGFK